MATRTPTVLLEATLPQFRLLHQCWAVKISSWPVSRGLPGRGHIIWPKQVYAAQQGMVLRILSQTGIQFHYLASGKGCHSGPEALNRV